MQHGSARGGISTVPRTVRRTRRCSRSCSISFGTPQWRARMLRTLMYRCRSTWVKEGDFVRKRDVLPGAEADELLDKHQIAVTKAIDHGLENRVRHSLAFLNDMGSSHRNLKYPFLLFTGRTREKTIPCHRARREERTAARGKLRLRPRARGRERDIL